MPKIPQPEDQPNKTESPRLTFVGFRQVTGVDTSAARTDIPEDKAYYLENVMPVGDGKLRVVPNISSTPLCDFGEAIYAMRGVNLNGAEKIVGFANSGNVKLVDVASGGVSNIASGLSGAGSWCDQWKNSNLLFIDANGYYQYDGTNFSKQTGTGAPSSGDNIVVYGDRVWITQNRALIVSGADGFDDGSVSGTDYWLPQNGAAVAALIDPAIRSKITRMIQANGLLYLFHQSGVNVISNVTVPVGANPPTPIWQNTNVQSAIGTDQPLSVVPYDRFNLFASKNGAYMMYGLAAPQLSSDLLGTWQYVDFTQPVSAGQVSLYQQLCAAFLVKRKGDPNLPDATVLAVWFQRKGKDRWFFCNFGAITNLVTSWVNGVPTLYALIGTKLYQLFAGGTPPAVTIKTKLWGLEDPTARKDVLMAGGFLDVYQQGSSLTLTVETETGANQSEISGTQVSGIGTFLISAGTPALNSRTLGFTLQANGYDFALHWFAADYKLRKRWGTPWV